MNDSVYKEPVIDLPDVFWNIMLHWRLILLCAFLCGVLAGAYSELRNRSEASGEEAAESADYYENALKSIDEGIARYQAALTEEQKYLENSLFMQLDPYHLYVTSTQYEIRSRTADSAESDLLSLGQAYAAEAVDADFLGKIAEKYETETQYIAELILSSTNDVSLMSTMSGTQAGTETVEDAEGTAQTEEGSGEPATAYYLTIEVLGREQEFADDISSAIEEHFTEINGELGYVKHTIKMRSRTHVQKVNRAYRANQKAVWDRIYDYTDKLVKAATNRENFVTKYESGSAALGQAVQRSTPKYAAVGFLGGLILSIFLLGLFYCHGSTVKSGRDLRERYGLRILGVFSGSGGKGLALDRLIRRKASPDTDGRTEDMCLRITAANIENAIRGRERVVVTGSLAEDTLAATVPKVRDSVAAEERARLDFRPGFLINPDSRKGTEGADGAILLEQKAVTSYAALEEELQLMRDLGVEVLGVVVI